MSRAVGVSAYPWELNPTMALHETAVRSAKPADKPRKLTDERGLFLLVNPSGSKLWRFKYRIDGREKLLALGQYPDVSLRQARDRRDEARRLVADGRDPSAERQKEKARRAGADTFGVIAEQWFQRMKAGWTPGHAVTVRSRLDRDVLPYLGRKLAAEVTARDVLDVLRRVEERGAIETAHRIKTICNGVMGWAVVDGHADRNPVADLPTNAIAAAIPKPMAALTDPKQIAALLHAIDGYPGTHVVRCAFKLAPLVFVRPGELRAAEWPEIDLDAGQWVIPAQRMKLKLAHKADPERSHIVPLSRQAVEVLRDLEPLTGSGRYVFPSARTTTRPMSEAALTAALRRLSYSGEEMSWHGFRAMASTLLNERTFAGRKFSADAIEAQLAHVQGSKVRAAYNRAAYLEERQQMMQAWADYLDELRATA